MHRAALRQTEQPVEFRVPAQFVGEDVPPEGARAARAERRVQRGGALLERGDVADRADDGQRRAVVRVAGETPVRDPGNLAVRPDDAEFADVGRVSGDRRLDPVQDAFTVLGVDQCSEGFQGAGELALLEPDHAVALRRPRHAPCRDVPGPDAEPGGLERQRQPFLGFDITLLDALLLRHVPHRAEHPDRTPVGRTEGTAMIDQPTHAAVREHDAKAVLERTGRGQRGLHRRLEGSAVVYVNALQKAGKAQRILRVRTGERVADPTPDHRVGGHVPCPQPGPRSLELLLEQLCRAGGRLGHFRFKHDGL